MFLQNSNVPARSLRTYSPLASHIQARGTGKSEKVSWEDIHHTINGSMSLHLTVHGRGQSTVPYPTTTDIQKAITCPGQLEVSPIKAATHGFSFDNFGLLTFDLRDRGKCASMKPDFFIQLPKNISMLTQQGSLLSW